MLNTANINGQGRLYFPPFGPVHTWLTSCNSLHAILPSSASLAPQLLINHNSAFTAPLLSQVKAQWGQEAQGGRNSTWEEHTHLYPPLQKNKSWWQQAVNRNFITISLSCATQSFNNSSHNPWKPWETEAEQTFWHLLRLVYSPNAGGRNICLTLSTPILWLIKEDLGPAEQSLEWDTQRKNSHIVAQFLL